MSGRKASIQEIESKFERALDRYRNAQDESELEAGSNQAVAFAKKLRKARRAAGLEVSDINRVMEGVRRHKSLSSAERKAKVTYKAFYRSGKWREVRYLALKRDGKRCACCGASSADGARLHVDHIVPRSKNRSLELELSNLQVLCEDCNLGKGNMDSVDHRNPPQDPRDRVIKELMEYCEELQDQIAILEMGRI